MTSRQRVEAALRHHEPDRTPIFEYVLLSPLADILLGRPQCEYSADPAEWEHSVRQHAIDRIDLAGRLGHDMMYVTPNPLPRTDTPTPAPADEGPADDPVERVKCRNELARRSLRRPSDDSFLIYHYLREEMTKRGVDLPILAPAYAHGVWTDADLMQTMLLAPEVAREHFALATQRTLPVIEKYLSLGIDQIGVGGDFAGNRPMISPVCYREFIMPEVRTLSRRIHGGGGWAVNASDGSLWEVIDDFLLGAEVDGYLEIDQRAGMELRPLKEAYGDRITFYGNIDCGNLLSFGTPEEVRRETHACLEAGQGNGGHIFCVSNAITASVPVGNYVAMVNGYRERFGLEELAL